MPRQGEGRTATLFANVTPDERERVHELARSRGVSASDYVRDTVVHNGETPREGFARVGQVLRTYRDGGITVQNLKGLENLLRDADLLRAADLTSDLGGTLPTSVSAPLQPFVDANRYAVNVCRRDPLSTLHGKTFQAPVITQEPNAGKQTTETTALTSRKMTVTADNITKERHGGYVTLTEQAADWSDPAFLQMLFENLAALYAVDTEAATCSAIATATTTTVAGPENWNDATFVHPALVAAAASVRGSCGNIATVLFAGGTTWDHLLGLQTSTGEPVYESFPNNVAGMTVVYSPGFSAALWLLPVLNTRRLSKTTRA